MKLSSDTLSVLKNFAKVNPSIIIPEGNTLKTISTNKTVMATAKVNDSFENRFAIYNLDRFISTVSLYTDPTLKFNQGYLDITEGGKKTKYVYGEEETIVKAPDREIKLPTVDVTVSITNENMKDVEKAGGVLGLSEIVIKGEDGKVYLQSVDVKNPTGDIYSIEVGETNKTFSAIFKTENIKILAGDYNVSISSKGISKWEGDKFPFEITYFIAVEASSTF